MRISTTRADNGTIVCLMGIGCDRHFDGPRTEGDIFLLCRIKIAERQGRHPVNGRVEGDDRLFKRLLALITGPVCRLEGAGGRVGPPSP